MATGSAVSEAFCPEKRRTVHDRAQMGPIPGQQGLLVANDVKTLERSNIAVPEQPRQNNKEG